MRKWDILLRNATEGDRCLGVVDGYWDPATILRVNEDGTFMLKFDDHPLLLPYTYGVTQGEISVNDESLWPEALAKVTGGKEVMSIADYRLAMEWCGFKVPEQKSQEVWLSICEELFGIREVGVCLTLEQSYQVLRKSAGCAKRILLAEVWPVSPYDCTYVNQVRMGGRDPGELGREITVQDALEALGVADSDVDDTPVFELDFIERKTGVQVPPDFREILSRSGLIEAVHGTHPNSPIVILPGDKGFRMFANPPLGDNPDMAITFMIRNQGGFSWSAVYRQGDKDARVYRNSEDEDDWSLVAPTSAFFFWDLAQTGLSWWQRPTIDGRKEVERTEIGLRLRGAPHSRSGVSGGEGA